MGDVLEWEDERYLHAHAWIFFFTTYRVPTREGGCVLCACRLSFSTKWQNDLSNGIAPNFARSLAIPKWKHWNNQQAFGNNAVGAAQMKEWYNQLQIWLLANGERLMFWLALNKLKWWHFWPSVDFNHVGLSCYCLKTCGWAGDKHRFDTFQFKWGSGLAERPQNLCRSC